jgi:hypothetical protein
MPAGLEVIASTAPARRRGRLALIPIGLAAWFAGQCCWFIGTQSFTYDEGPHIIAGLDAWRHGRFEQWNDQPPLGRLLVTAPLAVTRPDRWHLENLGPSGANFWTISIRPDPSGLAWHTRPVNVALALALMWLLWTTARRLLSESAANLAIALFACSPALIAHFSLATVDGLATVLCFAAAVAVARWRTHPSWWRTLGAGLLLGGLLVAKFSAPPLVLLALGLMTMSGPASERASRGAKAAAAAIVSLTVVWATYQWHVGPVTFRNGSLAGPYARGQTVIVPVARPLNLTIALPAPEFIAALGGVAQHAVRGQPTFLMGEVKTSGGWRRYFPIVILLKWPLTVWLLAVASLILLLTGRIELPGELKVLMLFPAVLFALATLTNLNIGDRYVLPVYPFLLLFCAAIWNRARARPAAMVLVVALVTCQAADAFRYAPDYLSYFNLFVSSGESYTLLSDSNLDWGQGLLALREYQRVHPDGAIWLAYFGGVDPASYAIRASSLGEHDRVRGTVVVSATHLSGQYLENPAAYRWLLQYPRKTILNHTLHVFEVP